MGLAVGMSGSASVLDRYLLPHERLHITVRQHPAVLAGSGFTVLTGLVAAVALVRVVWPGREVLDDAVWIVWGLLLLRTAFKAMEWLVSHFAVTSHRIMIVGGVFTRRLNIIPFWLVTNLSYRRSPVGRRLGYGEFRVQYGRQSPMLERLQYIPNPEQLYQEIREVFSGFAAVPRSGVEPDAEAEGDD